MCGDHCLTYGKATVLPLPWPHGTLNRWTEVWPPAANHPIG